MPVPDEIKVRTVSADEAAQHVDELADVYREVYAEPPYGWGTEHLELFVERFAKQRQNPGFRLVEARSDDELIGFGFGVSLGPTTPWWQGWLPPLPDPATYKYRGRVFMLVELLVRRSWRRMHVAEAIHDRLMLNRYERWATLTALPAARAAQAAYAKWGWRKVAQKRLPLPGSPIFDVLVKKLGGSGQLDAGTGVRRDAGLTDP